MPKRIPRTRDKVDDVRQMPDDPINFSKAPRGIPKEDRAADPHSFASDIDQQKMISSLQSDVAALRDEVRSLAKRITKLEK